MAVGWVAGERATAVSVGAAEPARLAATYSVRATADAALSASGAGAASRYTRNAGAARLVELLIWGAGGIYACAAARPGATRANADAKGAAEATTALTASGAGPARR